MSTEQKLDNPAGDQKDNAPTQANGVVRPLPEETGKQDNGEISNAAKIVSDLGQGETGVKNELNKKVKRTPGIWAFDFLVYPIFAYITVFAISVFASYQTNHGDPNTRVGKFFSSRKAWVKDKLFPNSKVGSDTIGMALAVAFSWIDGTFVSPFVKILEDNKIKIARKLDKVMGTTPKNPDEAYAHEPKQTWLSVLGSRFLTALTVVPIAFALDKKGKDGKQSWNYKLFEGPGKQVGERLEKNPRLRKMFPKLNFSGLFQFVFFEAFYSFVCMATAYGVAHIGASIFNKNKKKGVDSNIPVAADNTASASQKNKKSPIQAGEVDEQHQQEKRERLDRLRKNGMNVEEDATETGQSPSFSERNPPSGSIIQQRGQQTPMDQANREPVAAGATPA